MDHLQKSNKEYKSLKKQDSQYIYQNELDKPCFQHDMPYGDFKNIPRRINRHKMLCDKSFNIAKNLKYDGYQRGLASMVCKFFDKKKLLVVPLHLHDQNFTNEK